MSSDLTTTVTFADLISSHKDDLDELRDSYEDAKAYAKNEHGDNRLEWPQTVRQTLQAYDEGAKTIQNRIEVLKQFRDDYDDGEFELKMLSGQELTDIELQLRMFADKKGVEPQQVQSQRQILLLEKALVDAPEGFPTDDEGDPDPAAAPNPLTMDLHEQAEQLNQAGSVDFRAPGFDDGMDWAASDTSATPSTSATASSGSAPDETPTETGTTNS